MCKSVRSVLLHDFNSVNVDLTFNFISMQLLIYNIILFCNELHGGFHIYQHVCRWSFGICLWEICTLGMFSRPMHNIWLYIMYIIYLHNFHPYFVFRTWKGNYLTNATRTQKWQK